MEDDPRETRPRLIKDLQLRETKRSGQQTVPNIRTSNACLRRSMPGTNRSRLLADLGLPDSNGFETLETMLEAAGDEPVVVLTDLTTTASGLRPSNAAHKTFSSRATSPETPPADTKLRCRT